MARALRPRGDMTRAGRHAGPTMSVQSNCSSRGAPRKRRNATTRRVGILNFLFDSSQKVEYFWVVEIPAPSRLIDWREDGSGISALYHLWNWSSARGRQEYHFSTFRLLVLPSSSKVVSWQVTFPTKLIIQKKGFGLCVHGQVACYSLFQIQMER